MQPLNFFNLPLQQQQQQIINQPETLCQLINHETQDKFLSDAHQQLLVNLLNQMPGINREQLINSLANSLSRELSSRSLKLLIDKGLNISAITIERLHEMYGVKI